MGNRKSNYSMNWIEKISRIVCINLTHRDDRLLEFAKMADEYEIPFERISAINNPQQGAAGLRDTMIEIFSEAIENSRPNVLVFEDDALPAVQPPWVHECMNRALEQLPDTYHMMFLGCQLTSNVCSWYSTNLIKVNKAFSTHAVLYSLQGMKEIITKDFDYPIDNWYVDNIETMNQSFCTYPLLFTQRPGHSDIGPNYINWRPFIDQRFEQQAALIRR